MKQDGREHWLRNLKARQRNIVFPDTAANEATFWRALMARKEKLRVSQILGISLCA